jgi:gamma-glutamylcyclotransferase (GGCT)/AIG2-like uncharacterized protein YtfP
VALPGAHGLRPLRVPGPGRLSEGASELLFVYGTLRAGRAPRALAWLEALPREPASAPGRLLDLGPYPGAVTDARARVRGELVAVPAGRLAELDAYEGSADGPFARERCTARDAAGRERPCWIYRFTGDPAGHPEIPGGDWTGATSGES